MECPICGLINPDSAQRCDCGYDFLTQIIKKPYVKPTSKIAENISVINLIKRLYFINIIVAIALLSDYLMPSNWETYEVKEKNNIIIETNLPFGNKSEIKYTIKLSNSTHSLTKAVDVNVYNNLSKNDKVKIEHSKIFNLWKNGLILNNNQEITINGLNEYKYFLFMALLVLIPGIVYFKPEFVVSNDRSIMGFLFVILIGIGLFIWFIINVIRIIY